MRRRNRQLGAITAAARLEYFLPSSIADKIGGTGNYAFCMNAEDLIKVAINRGDVARYKSARATGEKSRIENLRTYGYDEATIAKEAKKREAKAKREGKVEDAFYDLAELVRKEIKALRDKGVRGEIPVCINRVTGKRGSGLAREMRRANAVHERFHADARRVEVDNGVESGACYKRLDALVDPYIGGTPLRYHALSRFANMRSKYATEELLARVEEVRKACKTKRAKTDCDLSLINIIKYMPEAEATAFANLVTGIDRDYGTPLNVVRAAVRSCSVR